MEHSLEAPAKLSWKKINKESRVRSESEQDELAEIAALKERFNHLKQDLVQDTVKGGVGRDI